MTEAVHDSAVATPSGPVTAGQRYLAPDLARGWMLLIVAVVHAHMYVKGSASLIRGYPADGSVLDSVASAVLTMFADGRSYPMFSALFGYGMVQILRRQERLGVAWPAARKLLRRRGWWLVLFGFFHVLLLFSGDILGTYGVIALIFVGMLKASDRKLFAHASVWFILGSLFYAAALFLSAAGGADHKGAALFAGTNPLTDALYRVGFWPFNTPLFAITSIFPFLIGVWAARRRTLEEPERHERLLRRTAAIGITAAALGGLPLALITSRVWSHVPGGLSLVFGILHTASGYAGGFGYAALIALVTIRLAGRPGRVVTAISACGQRSMTCYLLQSVAWLVLFAPYTLDLGEHIGVAWSVAIGTGTWLLTVLLADQLRRAGKRGPAETLLRRLTYRTAAG